MRVGETYLKDGCKQEVFERGEEPCDGNERHDCDVSPSPKRLSEF